MTGDQRLYCYCFVLRDTVSEPSKYLPVHTNAWVKLTPLKNKLTYAADSISYRYSQSIKAQSIDEYRVLTPNGMSISHLPPQPTLREHCRRSGREIVKSEAGEDCYKVSLNTRGPLHS